MMPKSRDKQYAALREEYKDLLDIPWEGKRLYGCYEIIRKYWEKVHDEKLIDFNSRGVIRFQEDAIAEQGAAWKFHKEWGEELDFSLLEKEDVLLFRLFTTPLGGNYSVPRGEAPNHGGIYLGDGWMLHHPYNDLSQLADLTDKYNKIYCSSCMGAIYKKDR